MVVWKEESYLGTKHIFKNLKQSCIEFKFCEQSVFLPYILGIVCETTKQTKQNKNSQSLTKQIICTISSLD